MYPRTNYEMTQDDMNALLDAMKSTPMIMLNCGSQRSVQEKANAAWARLGEKMGFDSDTAQPTGKGDRFFSAIPSETELHKTERIAREIEDEKRATVKKLEGDIKALQDKLSGILTS